MRPDPEQRPSVQAAAARIVASVERATRGVIGGRKPKIMRSVSAVRLELCRRVSRNERGPLVRISRVLFSSRVEFHPEQWLGRRSPEVAAPASELPKAS